MEPTQIRKSNRKLALGKETLRQLGPAELKEAAGANLSVSNQQTCRISLVFTCLPLVCV